MSEVEVSARSSILQRLDGHVAIVTINRPDRLNALDPETSEKLSRVWDEVRDDDDVWVAVLTGSGERAFSVGFDLKWAAEHPDAPVERLTGPNGFGGLTRRRDLYKPVVAAVRGFCLGGGFEMALSCDFIVAGEGARFGFPEPTVGNVAMWGGVQRLARMVPRSQASRILLACERVSVQEAEALGLVYAVVPDGSVMNHALELAHRLCRAAPLAVQATKALYLQSLERPLSEAIAEAPMHPLMVHLQASADHAEGVRAFSERREPKWTGR